MDHERAQANLEVVFDWVNALRYGDIDSIADRFHPDVVWIDMAGGVPCSSREQVLAWLRSQSPESREVDAIELLGGNEHVVLGVRNHARQELAGVELQDGQVYTVFTLREGQIVRLRGHTHREDALKEAGLEDYEWR
jgi:ketosteroid isomerase-like protein